MSRSATAWKRNDDEASAMISKEHFDSTIGFIRSDVADLKADVREMRSRMQAQDDKNAAFEKDVNEKFDAFRQDINGRFDAFRQEINGRFDAFRQDINDRFDAFRQEINGRFDAFRQDINDRFDAFRQEIRGNLDALRERFEERFEQIDEGLTRLETSFAKMLGWQKAIMLFLALILTMMGGLFTAMAKGFHWF